MSTTTANTSLTSRPLVTPLNTAAWAGRAAVALVWLYHGLWCKLLHVDPVQARVADDITAGTSLIEGPAALAVVGCIETLLAAWVITGTKARAAAWVQTLLLCSMNGAGLAWASDAIPQPGAMLVNNAALLALVWLLARRTAS